MITVCFPAVNSFDSKPTAVISLPSAAELMHRQHIQLNMSLDDKTLTRIVGEANGQGGSLDFVLENVCLVEEEHYGRVVEELVVADTVEQMEALVHTILMETRKSAQHSYDQQKDGASLSEPFISHKLHYILLQMISTVMHSHY